MTPLERLRGCLGSLLTRRDPAKEVRAFELAGYLRRRWEGLWDERMVELRATARRRLRRSLAAGLGSVLLTAVALGVLAWLYVSAAGRLADVDEVLAALPEGYATLLGNEFVGGRDLSKGQWQRVALARAFFRDAPVIVLDEPTAALDARAEHDLFERVRDLFRGRAVLLISHRFSSVRSADRIYVLQAGRVVEHGTHDELLAAGGLYAELFTLQAAAYLEEPAGPDTAQAPGGHTVDGHPPGSHPSGGHREAGRGEGDGQPSPLRHT
jgi:hypothetical protein